MKRVMKFLLAAVFSTMLCSTAFAVVWHNDAACTCGDNCMCWDDDFYGYNCGCYNNDYDGGDVGFVSDVWWSGSTAYWDSYGNSTRFYVKLYRDGYTVTTEHTSGHHLNLGSHMTRGGDYSFQVRAYYDGEYSEWSDESDTRHVSGSSNNNNNNNHNSNNGPLSAGGQWLTAQDGSGRWWYRHSDGTCTRNNWESIGGKWYFFDGEGWMKMGWINWNGGTYFCGVDGVMLTGAQNLGGHIYYFDANGRFIQ